MTAKTLYIKAQKEKHGTLHGTSGRVRCVFFRFSLLFSIIPLFLCLFSACRETAPLSSEIYAMDTYMELKAYGGEAEDLLEKAEKEIFRLERLFSATSAESELYRLNLSGSGAVSPELAEIISVSLALSRKTGGAFDPSVRPLLRLWGFTEDEFRVPSEAGIAAALERVGDERISADGTEVLLNGCELDLGGIAKGYAADRFAGIAAESLCGGAFANLGGMICAAGTKPGGEPWRVALQSPLGEGYAAVLSVSNVCISTSGAYQRFFESGGKRYHHIIDPSTGFPAESDLLSATVIDESGCFADAVSTALFVMGEDASVKFCRQNGVCAILITEDMRLLCLGGAEDFIEEVSGETFTLCIG